jgi:hypothetical protein
MPSFVVQQPLLKLQFVNFATERSALALLEGSHHTKQLANTERPEWLFIFFCMKYGDQKYLGSCWELLNLLGVQNSIDDGSM